MLRKKYTPGAYDVCITCKHRELGYCNGPRTTGMTPERRVEFIRDLKDFTGNSNAAIAEAVGISEKTVENYCAGKNVQLWTACAIENYLFGSAGTYPCPLEVVEDATADIMQMREELEKERRRVEKMKAEAEAFEEDSRTKINHLLEEIRHMRVECDGKEDTIRRLWAMLDAEKEKTK